MKHTRLQKTIGRVIVLFTLVHCSSFFVSTEAVSFHDEFGGTQDIQSNILRDVNPGTDEGIRQITFKIGENIDTIDSKIDELFVDFQETWTMLESNSTGFKETWTILGDPSDAFVSDQEVLESTINTYTLSVIGWLKTLYAMNRGWTA